jgi:hypothetical protein
MPAVSLAAVEEALAFLCDGGGYTVEEGETAVVLRIEPVIHLGAGRSLIANEAMHVCMCAVMCCSKSCCQVHVGVTTRKCSECTTSGTLSELRPPVEIAAAAAL